MGTGRAADGPGSTPGVPLARIAAWRESALFATPMASFVDVGDAALDRELTRRLVVESEHAPSIARSWATPW